MPQSWVIIDFKTSPKRKRKLNYIGLNYIKTQAKVELQRSELQGHKL
jgi:hypothetical protein